MRPISFKRHRFPANLIRPAVWLYFRFALRFRDVEDLLAERGIERVSAQVPDHPGVDLQHLYTARHLLRRRTLKGFRAAAHQVWLRQTCAPIS